MARMQAERLRRRDARADVTAMMERRGGFGRLRTDALRILAALEEEEQGRRLRWRRRMREQGRGVMTMGVGEL